jgi:PTS system mannitol-specific IIC component
MKPKTILATIAGGMSGIAVGSLLGAGLVAPASPGSIIAWFLMCPRNGYLPMILDFAVATAVSFLVASALIRPDKRRDEEAAAQDALLEPAATAVVEHGSGAELDATGVRRVVVACDAGMGSSVMVASTLKKKLSPLGVEVLHTPVDEIPRDATLVLTHEGLADRARSKAPQAQVVPFSNYMSDPAFAKVEEAIRRAHDATETLTQPASARVGALSIGGESAPGPASVTSARASTVGTATVPKTTELASAVLPREAIKLGLRATDKLDAIRQAGQTLVQIGAAEPAYIDGMIAREDQISTYLGEGFAIPHGTNEARTYIKRAALGFLQFPEGVDWDGQTCYVAIPIASKTDEHIDIIAALAGVLADQATAEQLRTATSIDEVLALLAPKEDQS